MRYVAALIVVFIALCARAEGPVRAMDAYEHVQAIRKEAAEVAKSREPEDIRKAVARLQGALAYLAREDVTELGDGNPFLRFRNHDVRMDLAGDYAALGEDDKALELLEAMQEYVLLPDLWQHMRQAPEFQRLAGNPRFEMLMERAQTTRRLWAVPAMATPYKERLTVEERMAGLALFWSEARQNFVYFDHIPKLAWDQVYMDFVPKVLAAQTTADYYRVMMQLAPLLEDSHTNIYPPKELQDAFYSRPPVRTARMGDRVIVTEVMSASLAQRVRVGDEVVSIDGVPVRRYAEERVRPFASSSTPQDRDVRMYTYQLFSGDKAAPLELRLRAPDGGEREEVVARTGYSDVNGTKPFRLRVLDGGMAYLPLEHFSNEDALKAFEQALPEILKSKGLVLDLRHNQGGNGWIGFQILSYLTDKPIATAIARQRVDVGTMRANAVRWQPVAGSGTPIRIKRDRHFDGPVAVLIGPQTISAGEDFVVAFELAKRGITVGEPTAGSTGQPMMIALPGGGQARVCVKRDEYPDGREFVGKGIAPTIAVTQTVEDFRADRDVALDRAVAALMHR